MPRPHLFLPILLCLCVGGCSLFDLGSSPGSDDVSGEEATLALMFSAQSETHERSAFRMTFSDGKRVYTLERDDFTPVGNTQFNAGPFDTATSGTLRVACSVLDGRGSVIATEALSLPLRPDQRYDVICSAGPHNPYRSCFGCWGFEARSLERKSGLAPGDSLFVVWSKNSISNPVDY